MSTVAERVKARKARRPIYVVVRKLIDPATGEVVGALVPSHPVDRRLMRERGYFVGNELRAELKKPRNPAFHRMVHALGGMLVDNLPDFEGLDQHGAIKRLQREAGAFCEEADVELPGLGRLTIKLPRSIAFDEMDEGEFAELWQALVAHVVRTYWPSMTEAQVSEQAELISKRGGGA